MAADDAPEPAMINDLNLEDLRTYSIWGSEFHIPKKYTIKDAIGQGAYGIVVYAQAPRPIKKCEEEGKPRSEGTTDDDIGGSTPAAAPTQAETHIQVAIKKIENVFDCLTLAKRTLRELRIIRHMHHENVMGLITAFVPEPKGDFDDVYMVCEHMETDLSSILKSKQPLTDGHHQFWMYQLLRGMKYVHSAEVVHRDLKPRNILVSSNCDLKICDFGLARVCFDLDSDYFSPLTDYICTRWYRGPELLSGVTIRDLKKVDIWSMGCIFAEMLGRRPIFPGRNTHDQFSLIVAYTGVPSHEEIAQMNTNTNTNSNNREYSTTSAAGSADRGGTSGSRKFHIFLTELALKATKEPRKMYEESLPNAPKTAIDLLQTLLKYRPSDRPTVGKALQHAYLKGLYCPEDEPTTVPIEMSGFEFERRNATVETMREEIWLEILEHYPEKKAEYLKSTKYNILSVGLKPKMGSNAMVSESDDSGIN